MTKAKRNIANWGPIWRPSGRSFVMKFGHFSVSVICKGSRARGDKVWAVGDVFGHPYLGSGWRASLGDALDEAEKLGWKALRELARYAKEIR